MNIAAASATTERRKRRIEMSIDHEQNRRDVRFDFYVLHCTIEQMLRVHEEENKDPLARYDYDDLETAMRLLNAARDEFTAVNLAQPDERQYQPLPRILDPKESVPFVLCMLVDLKPRAYTAGEYRIHHVVGSAIAAIVREQLRETPEPKPKPKQKYRMIARYRVDCLLGVEEAESSSEAYAQYRCRYGDTATDALQLEIYRQTGHNARLETVYAKPVEEK
jgi:hypothetical protein